MAQKWANKYQRKPGRWVFDPTPEYRLIGEEIRKATRKVWRPPSYYFHLREGGHVKALQRHMRNTYFVRLDIEDFFGSINRTRLTRCLKEFFGFPDARRMADESTVRHPTEKGRWVLPYGFIQSPMLASLALSKSRIGTYLDQLHKTKGMKVSVYVDDIIVSCNDSVKLEEVCNVLVKTAQKAGLRFNPAKSQGPAAIITAFNIELTKASLAIVAERLAEFAVALGTGSDQKRKGILGYVKSVNAAQAEGLKS